MSNTVIGPIRGGSPGMLLALRYHHGKRIVTHCLFAQLKNPSPDSNFVWFFPARILRLLPVPRFDAATAVGDLSFQWSHRLDIA